MLSPLLQVCCIGFEGHEEVAEAAPEGPGDEFKLAWLIDSLGTLLLPFGVFPVALDVLFPGDIGLLRLQRRRHNTLDDLPVLSHVCLRVDVMSYNKSDTQSQYDHDHTVGGN